MTTTEHLKILPVFYMRGKNMCFTLNCVSFSFFPLAPLPCLFSLVVGFAFSWSCAQHTWFVTGPVHDKHHCQFLMLLAAAKFCPSVYFQATHLTELVQCVYRFQLTTLPRKEQNFHLMTVERKAG